MSSAHGFGKCERATCGTPDPAGGLSILEKVKELLDIAFGLLLFGGCLFTFFYPWRFHTKARLALLHLPLRIVFVRIQTGGNPSPFFVLIVLV